MLANLLAHHAREHIINSVSWSGGDDAPLDGLADESHVANDVEQLVTGWLIVPHERLMLDVAEIVGIVMLSARQLAQLVEVLLCGLPLIDNDGIVQVTSLDETGQKQLLYLSNKDEGTGSCHFGHELVHAVEGGKLAAKHFPIK